MPDPWDLWDARVKQTGDPTDVAADLSDLEVLNLLAAWRAERRDLEKQILKREAFVRMQARLARDAPIEEPYEDSR